jgi:hypothetical protein
MQHAHDLWSRPRNPVKDHVRANGHPANAGDDIIAISKFRVNRAVKALVSGQMFDVRTIVCEG